jgi:hypothetical protein
MGLGADSGVLIQRVISGGAAERAGLHGGNQQAYVGNTPIMLGGDLIVAIDGQQITDPQDISVVMDKHQAGDTISVTILRGRRQITPKADRSCGRRLAFRRLQGYPCSLPFVHWAVTPEPWLAALPGSCASNPSKAEAIAPISATTVPLPTAPSVIPCCESAPAMVITAISTPAIDVFGQFQIFEM